MLHLLQEYLARKQLTSVPIEVETRTLEEVQEVLSLMDHQQHDGVARLMLDNMTRLDSSKPGVRDHGEGYVVGKGEREGIQCTSCSAAAPRCHKCLRLDSGDLPGSLQASCAERWTPGKEPTCSVAALLRAGHGSLLVNLACWTLQARGAASK